MMYIFFQVKYFYYQQMLSTLVQNQYLNDENTPNRKNVFVIIALCSFGHKVEKANLAENIF